MLLVFSSNLRNAAQPTKDLVTLLDYFTGPEIDTSKWVVTNQSNGTITSITEIVNGKLQFTIPTGFIGGASISTPLSQFYKFNANAAYFRLTSKSTDNGAETWFQLKDYAGTTPGKSLYWYFTGANIIARTTNELNFGAVDLFTTAYDAAAHAWFRIRESGGTTYWETAPATAANPPLENQWVVRASQANYLVGTTVQASINARNWQNIPNANQPQYDSINVGTVPYVAPLVSTLTDSFSTTTIDPTKWATIGGDANNVVAQSGGKLNISVAAGVLGGCGLGSLYTYKFTASSAFTKVTQTTDFSSTDAVFELRDLSGTTAGLGVQWSFGLGAANARTVDTNGIATIVGSLTFNLNTPWFRIRESAGTVYWETAPNTAANPPAENQWVVQFSQARAMLGTNVTVKYIVRHLQTGTAAVYAFDSINAATSQTSPVRFIRDHVENSGFGSPGNGAANNHWVEIQALDADGVVVSTGATATANTPVAGTSPRGLSGITDGDLDTNNYVDFNNPAGGTTVTVDLGSIKQVANINIRHYYGDGRTYFNEKTEVSPDGITWYTTWDYTVNGTYSENSNGRTDAIPQYTYADTTIPTVTAATVTNALGNNKIRLTFSEPLQNIVPALAQFSISGSHPISQIAFEDTNYTSLIFTISNTIVAGETVTISYVVPATNKLADPSNNLVAAFTNRAITNSLTATPSTRLRYIQVHIDGAYDGAYNQYADFTEIQAYDLNGTNVALNKPVTADWTTDGPTLAKWVDGDTTSSFYAGLDSKSMTVDLGSLQDITSIKTWQNSALTNRAFYKTIFISSDGINWTAVFDTETQGLVYETSAGQTLTAPFSGAGIPYYWQYIGGENASAYVADNTLVRYGIRGSYGYVTTSGWVTLNNATFGDPAYGVAKHGDQRIANPAYVDPTPVFPVISSATISSAVGDTKIRLLFSQTMANVNPYAQFSVSGHTVTGAAFVDQSRTYLDITVTPAFVQADVVTLSYTIPSTSANGYQNGSGALLQTFSGAAVTNTIGPVAGVLSIVTRNVVRPYQSQPQVPAPLNLLNTATRGLRSLLLPYLSNRDLITRNDWYYAYGANGVSRGVFQKGRALNAAGFASDIPTVLSSGRNIAGVNADFSFLVIAYRNATVSGSQLARVVCQGNDQNGWELNFGNAYTGVESDFARFQGPTLTNNRIYLNGVKQTSPYFTNVGLNNKQLYNVVCSGFNGNNAYNTVLFNSEQDAYNHDRSLYGGIMMVAFWDRILTDAEAQSLSINPWQLFAQYKKQYMASQAGIIVPGVFAAHMPFFVF